MENLQHLDIFLIFYNPAQRCFINKNPRSVIDRGFK